MRFRVEEFGEVSSTNDIVKEAIGRGEPEGLAVVAESQTGGYGRRGTRWESGPGGLYMSLLLRPGQPVEDIQTLSLVTAIAVRRTLAAFARPEVQGLLKIKWPNDVVVMGRSAVEGMCFDKICGISVEQKGGAVCVGIGVNVARLGDGCASGEPSDEPSGRNVPAYLSDIASDGCGTAPSIAEVRDLLLDCFAAVYDEWKEASFGPFRSEFMRNFALDGFKIRIDGAGPRPIRCEVMGVSPQGHLLVCPEGEDGVREIAAGSVSLIERTSPDAK